MGEDVCMLFNSMEFLIFFPVVVVLYYFIPGRGRHLWLLAASYYFYMCWNVKYALLILFSTVVTYAGGIIMERVRERRGRKLVTAAGILLSLGVLFYFKYVDFAMNLLVLAFRAVHIQLRPVAFDVLLPVGISFYTFQSMGYLIDVYRGEIYAERNFFRYALFVSFFPQLVAGPIERSGSLLKQLAGVHKFSFDRAREGLLLMLWGFFLKIVLADRIAIFVDTVYGDGVTYPGWYLIVATVLFAFQIYCDFYGYSVIAMGAALILGIRLMENFDAPYLAGSVAGFWRRWHISLTSWFRDYLYIPLGGSRRGRLRKYMNRMIVFMASGFWHGARLSFAVWGLLNGAYQVIGELLEPLRAKAARILGLNRNSLGHRLAGAAGTFVLVDISWIFFRAEGLRTALGLIRQMLTGHNPWILMDGSLYQCGLDEKNFRLMIYSLFVLLFADICKWKGIRIREVIARQDFWFRCLVVVGAVCVILTFGVWGPGYREAGFIYFQF